MLRKGSQLLLKHQVELAPGSLSAAFSTSLSDALPGGGRGRGGPPRKPGGADRAPGSRQGDDRQQRGNPGMRAPSQERSRQSNQGGGNFQQRGGNSQRRGGGGGGQRSNYQNRGGGGGGGNFGAEISAFKEALKLDGMSAMMPVPGNPGKTQEVDFLDLLPPHINNTSMAPFLKYAVSDAEMQQLMAGTLRPSEQRMILAKLEAMLVNNPQQRKQSIMADIRIESEPNYQIEKLFNNPDAPDREVPADVLVDAFKSDFMKLFHLTEDEYEKYKQEAVQEMGDVPSLAISDARAAANELETIAQEVGVTPSNPLYDSFIEKIKVIEGNSQWPQERKRVMAKRLAKHFVMDS